MKRDEVINLLIKKNNYKKYLEIGIGDGVNYEKIVCDFKSNVDPFFDKLSGQCENKKPIFQMTSDEFFSLNKDFFDIVFVDGLHLFEQTLRDILNSLSFLNDNGIIVVHDTLPPTEWHQRENFEGGEWNGTCWKAIAHLRMTNPNVSIKTIDTDWGISLIEKRKSNLFVEEKIVDYNFFSKNRNELMNVISVESFISHY